MVKISDDNLGFAGSSGSLTYGLNPVISQMYPEHHALVNFVDLVRVLLESCVRNIDITG